MPLLIVGLIGAAVLWYYARSAPATTTAAGAVLPAAAIAPSYGYVQGTTPPGTNTDLSGAAGPNTTMGIIGTGGAAGASLATMAGTTAGITALGAATVGIGVVVGVGLALWQAHIARVKGAQTENAVLNDLVPAFSVALSKEFDALNNNQVSPTVALQDLEAIRTSYWQAIAKYQSGPGQHTHPCSPLAASDAMNTGEYAPGCYPWLAGGVQVTPCDNSCTAGCCIGCDYVEPAICAAKWLINVGGGSVKIHPVAGSKYGYTGQPGFTLVYAKQVS